MSRNDGTIDESHDPGEGERVTIDLGPQTAHSDTIDNPMGNLAASIGTRNLLIAIITMPLVFIVVVIGIIAIFGDKDDESQIAGTGPELVRSTPLVETLSEPALSPTNVVVAGTAPEAIILPQGADIGAMSLDGERLAVRIDGPDGAMVVIYDLGLGAVVQTVPITAGDGSN